MEIVVDQFETYADGLDHPEDIAFDSDGVLWAGGEAGQVYRIPEKGRVEEVTNVGGFCLGLAFSPSDELYICNSKLASVIKVQKNGKSKLFADSAGNYKLKLPNYGVFDSAGNPLCVRLRRVGQEQRLYRAIRPYGARKSVSRGSTTLPEWDGH